MGPECGPNSVPPRSALFEKNKIYETDDSNDEINCSEQTSPHTTLLDDACGEFLCKNRTVNGDYDATIAEELYMQSCVSCHGDDLSESVEPSLKIIGSNLSEDGILEGI